MNNDDLASPHLNRENQGKKANKSTNEKFCSTRRAFVKVKFEHSSICILYLLNCLRKMKG